MLIHWWHSRLKTTAGADKQSVSFVRIIKVRGRLFSREFLPSLLLTLALGVIPSVSATVVQSAQFSKGEGEARQTVLVESAEVSTPGELREVVEHIRETMANDRVALARSGVVPEITVLDGPGVEPAQARLAERSARELQVGAPLATYQKTSFLTGLKERAFQFYRWKGRLSFSLVRCLANTGFTSYVIALSPNVSVGPSLLVGALYGVLSGFGIQWYNEEYFAWLRASKSSSPLLRQLSGFRKWGVTELAFVAFLTFGAYFAGESVADPSVRNLTVTLLRTSFLGVLSQLSWDMANANTLSLKNAAYRRWLKEAGLTDEQLSLEQTAVAHEAERRKAAIGFKRDAMMFGASLAYTISAVLSIMGLEEFARQTGLFGESLAGLGGLLASTTAAQLLGFRADDIGFVFLGVTGAVAYTKSVLRLHRARKAGRMTCEDEMMGKTPAMGPPPPPASAA